MLKSYRNLDYIFCSLNSVYRFSDFVEESFLYSIRLLEMRINRY